MHDYTITLLITKTTTMLDAGRGQLTLGWKRRIIIPASQRPQILQLRDLLNNRRNPYQSVLALHNNVCWQWEYPVDHSSQAVEPFRTVGMDWPNEADLPDIDTPSITINLTTG